jgi:hypothetical protein
MNICDFGSVTFSRGANERFFCLNHIATPFQFIMRAVAQNVKLEQRVRRKANAYSH